MDRAILDAVEAEAEAGGVCFALPVLIVEESVVFAIDPSFSHIDMAPFASLSPVAAKLTLLVDALLLSYVCLIERL